jgi:hypothetical protein
MEALTLRAWLLAGAALVLLLAGAALGRTFEKNARTQLELAWAKERATLADERAALTARALDAERAGAQAATRLAASEAEKSRLGKEKDRAIARLTTGRRCLDAAVVGVLNDAPSGAGLRLPATAAATAGAAAAFATDADVGQWARHARDQYERCRGRLDALREWHQGVP